MFRTELITNFYQENDFKSIYKNLHEKKFHNAKNNLSLIENKVQKFISQDELVLNDIYLINKILSFHTSLITMWEEISIKNYSNSWKYLQDSLDSLRNINKFSINNQKEKVLSFFEKQLLILEKLYPYKIFASIGWEVKMYECSICGNDIDSFECEHDKGELYNGEIAIGIANDITDINHISMVENPMDKRCVVEYDNEAQQFKGLHFLNKKLLSNELTPITIYDIDETPRKKPNEEYVKLARNEKCFCGSNKKFKKCCITKQYIEEEHIELIIKHEFTLW
ncbi:YecA family protein [Arcobacter peruensis]|uniref:YecA family protein n=1 Tax=Arcobacter peruensis TaxID=2320140 RepID=UPI000F096947|nr:SEC-C metal-binding domain-containing protein [Arcobacter peruensis]